MQCSMRIRGRIRMFDQNLDQYILQGDFYENATRSEMDQHSIYVIASCLPMIGMLPTSFYHFIMVIIEINVAIEPYPE
jgi:hypothetical protein